MTLFKTAGLFVLTAAAEIFGCYAVFLWLRGGKSAWWLLPSAASLALFAWLLTLHPSVGAGRTYAAYGGVNVATSIIWLRYVEGVRPDRWDFIGSGLCVLGMMLILFGPRE